MRVNHPAEELADKVVWGTRLRSRIDFVLVCLGNYRAEIKRVRAGMV